MKNQTKTPRRILVPAGNYLVLGTSGKGHSYAMPAPQLTQQMIDGLTETRAEVITHLQVGVAAYLTHRKQP